MKSKIYNLADNKLYAGIAIAFVVYVAMTIIALGLLDYLMYLKWGNYDK